MFIEKVPFAELISDEEIALVQNSFRMIAPITNVAAEWFYGRLFELDPSLRPLFKGDMKTQGRKLMQMLSVAVNGLHDLDAIVLMVHDLGKRHVAYGVKNEHYVTVGEALLWTLDKGLGSDFTPEVEAAWRTVYGVLAGAAMEGASMA